MKIALINGSPKMSGSASNCILQGLETLLGDIKAGCKWGQGIGVGAGPMIPIGKGPMKNLGKALQQLANNVSNCASGETTYVTASFPKLLYKLVAEMSMRQGIKANGLRRKDLYRKSPLT